jgi:membrane protease YdiL (CAAX protease family)
MHEMALARMWEKRSVIFLGILILLTLFGGVLLAAIVTHLPSVRVNPVDLGFITLLCTTAGFHGGTFVWIHFFLRTNRVTWSQAFGLRRNNLGACIVTALVALPIVLSGVILLGKASTWTFVQLHEIVGWQWLQPPPQDERQYPEFLPMSFLFMKGIVEILLTPAAEELIFRGVIYRTLRERWRTFISLCVTSVIFAGVHFYPVGALSLAFLSGVLVIVYERTGNLLAPFFLHAFFNAFNFVVLVAEPAWARSLWQF